MKHTIDFGYCVDAGYRRKENSAQPYRKKA